MVSQKVLLCLLSDHLLLCRRPRGVDEVVVEWGEHRLYLYRAAVNHRSQCPSATVQIRLDGQRGGP